MSLQESNVTTIRNEKRDRAVIFLHGFTGSRDDTWDRFPGLLGIALGNWDIFTVGYATTMLPDVVGVGGSRLTHPEHNALPAAASAALSALRIARPHRP